MGKNWILLISLIALSKPALSSTIFKGGHRKVKKCIEMLEADLNKIYGFSDLSICFRGKREKKYFWTMTTRNRLVNNIDGLNRGHKTIEECLTEAQRGLKSTVNRILKKDKTFIPNLKTIDLACEKEKGTNKYYYQFHAK